MACAAKLWTERAQGLTRVAHNLATMAVLWPLWHNIVIKIAHGMAGVALNVATVAQLWPIGHINIGQCSKIVSRKGTLVGWCGSIGATIWPQFWSTQPNCDYIGPTMWPPPLTWMRPAAAPAVITEVTLAGSSIRRSTFPYTPNVMALMAATPPKGELRPRYRPRTYTQGRG